jgi:Bacterial type II/III secretion system short domain
MTIRKRQWILAAMAIVTIGTPLFAQEAEGRRVPIKGTKSNEIKVVKLSFIAAQPLAAQIDKLDLPVRVTAVGNKQIMIRGQKAAVEHVLTSVVKVLDVPETDEGDVITAILPLPTGLRRASDVLALIRAGVESGQRARIAVDDRTRTLVVRARPEEIETIKAVFAHLAKPTRAVLIECFFIRGKLSAGQDDNSPLPAHLSSVGQALGENGLTNLELLAPMMISAQEGMQFESEAVFGETFPDTTGIGGEMGISVEGTVQVGSDGQVAELTIQSRVRGDYRNHATVDGKTEFILETSVAVPIGDYAILAAAPSSTASGDVIALAVRVTTK